MLLFFTIIGLATVATGIGSSIQALLSVMNCVLYQNGKGLFVTVFIIEDCPNMKGLPDHISADGSFEL